MKNKTVERFDVMQDEIARLKKDLEQKDRELEIHAALERVRSRTSAMQDSTEMNEVVATVYTELAQLGIDVHLSLILIYDWKTKQMEWWSSGQGIDKMPQRFRVQITPEIENHPWVTRYFEAQKNKIEFEFYKLEGEIKKTIDKYLFEQTDLKTLPDDFKQTMSGIQSVMLAEAFMKRGVLSVSVFEELMDSDIDLIKRFARVIDEAFNRVEELRIAETSVKEAKIEAALERVRGRAMAIRKSDELREVVTLIFKELNYLGFDLLESNLLIFDPPSKDLIVWGSGPGETDLATGTKLQYFKHPFLDELFKDINAGKKFRSGTIGGSQLKSYFDKLYTLTDFRNTPCELIEANYKIKKVHFRQAIFSHGFLELIATEPILEEKEEILKRFAKVIDLTYTRFDDIVQAEIQAREAQIEAALERVRAQSMAMHKSDELAVTAAILFQQMTELGVTPERLNICLIKEADKILEVWATDQQGSKISHHFNASLDEPTTGKRVYEAWREKRKSIVIDLSGKELNDWIRYVREVMGMSIKAELVREHRIHSVAFFSQGMILTTTPEPLPKESIKLLERFADVFNLTYRRFLDLQKAEAQAREAVKQASLDRVRGEIASMRNSDDLNRITPVIWHELQALEVPFIRSGVFIIDEKTQLVSVYLSTPEGQALAVLNLAFDANDLTRNTVEHWRKKRIFKSHWNKDDFIKWTHSMMEMGQVESEEKYQGSASAPESLNLHFIPFKQGMLYVGNVNPLAPEKLDLVKTLAEAFSIAYARYEDFKNLEEAKEKIESTLNELKAAQNQLVQAEKMASLGELTAGIAHEIQNPLNFVNNFSEVSTELLDELKQELENGEIEEVKTIVEDVIQNLEKILHHGKRAESIVKGMLLHSRGSSGKKEPTDINALCDEYLRLSYHGFRAKDKSSNADFKLEADENLPKIDVVPQDIGRVLLNLINNAFYAVSEKSKLQDSSYKPQVIVSTKMQGGKIEIRVKDNGPGIPEKVKEKIFQPFFTTKPTGQGTGLGLSLSYDIVKAHDGELKLETRKDEGSAFIIQLKI